MIKHKTSLPKIFINFTTTAQRTETCLPNTKARPCDVPTAITFETVCKHNSTSDMKGFFFSSLIKNHKKVKYSLLPLASQHQLYPEERWKE